MNDPTWTQAGNTTLVIMTLAYVASVALFALLGPKGLLQWATLLKVLGPTLVWLNACLVVFFGVGTDQPLRVVVFMIATAFVVIFDVVSWREWIARRRREAR